MSSKLQRSSRDGVFRHNGCRRSCAVVCAGFLLGTVLAGPSVAGEPTEQAVATRATLAATPGDVNEGVAVPGGTVAGDRATSLDGRPGLIASWIAHAKRGIDDVVSVSVRRPQWREGSEVFLSPLSSRRRKAAAGLPAAGAEGAVHLGLCVRGSSRESIERGQTTAPTIGLGLELAFH